METQKNCIPDAENTVRIMEQATCLVVILNTNQKTPFIGVDCEKRIEEICDFLAIGVAVENMILTAGQHGLDSLGFMINHIRMPVRLRLSFQSRRMPVQRQ